jgi:hypothetical protein
MGTLRLGVPGAGGQTVWLDELKTATATFRPGYSDYELTGDGWKASVSMAPALDFHGLICRVEFDRETPLVWQYGGIFWRDNEANTNRVEIADIIARITEPNLQTCRTAWCWRGGTARGPAAQLLAVVGSRLGSL